VREVSRLQLEYNSRYHTSSEEDGDIVSPNSSNTSHICNMEGHAYTLNKGMAQRYDEIVEKVNKEKDKLLQHFLHTQYVRHFLLLLLHSIVLSLMVVVVV
jgi:hypothetical protein